MRAVAYFGTYSYTPSTRWRGNALAVQRIKSVLVIALLLCSIALGTPDLPCLASNAGAKHGFFFFFCGTELGLVGPLRLIVLGKPSCPSSQSSSLLSLLSGVMVAMSREQAFAR
jgi:hypothetical protein